MSNSSINSPVSLLSWALFSQVFEWSVGKDVCFSDYLELVLFHFLNVVFVTFETCKQFLPLLKLLPSYFGLGCLVFGLELVLDCGDVLVLFA